MNRAYEKNVTQTGSTLPATEAAPTTNTFFLVPTAEDVRFTFRARATHTNQVKTTPTEEAYSPASKPKNIRQTIMAVATTREPCQGKNKAAAINTTKRKSNRMTLSGEYPLNSTNNAPIEKTTVMTHARHFVENPSPSQKSTARYMPTKTPSASSGSSKKTNVSVKLCIKGDTSFSLYCLRSRLRAETGRTGRNPASGRLSIVPDCCAAVRRACAHGAHSRRPSSP